MTLKGDANMKKLIMLLSTVFLVGCGTSEAIVAYMKGEIDERIMNAIIKKAYQLN